MKDYVYQDIASKLTVVDKTRSSVFTSWVWTGFESKEEAQFFAEEWKNWIGWGYSPSAYVRQYHDGSYIVDAQRANSCD
jgi:hypothetical protein